MTSNFIQQSEKPRPPRRNVRTPTSRLVSSTTAPLVPFQCYKLPQSVVDALERYAVAMGWSRGAVARKVLTDWARTQGTQGKKGKRQAQ